jgi:hypothetical protein
MRWEVLSDIHIRTGTQHERLLAPPPTGVDGRRRHAMSTIGRCVLFVSCVGMRDMSNVHYKDPLCGWACLSLIGFPGPVGGQHCLFPLDTWEGQAAVLCMG